MIGRWNIEENGWKSAAGTLETGPKCPLSIGVPRKTAGAFATADNVCVSAQKRRSGIRLNNSDYLQFRPHRQQHLGSANEDGARSRTR